MPTPAGIRQEIALLKAPPEAFRTSDLFQTGIGHVVISRYKADGRVEAGFFLVDVFCLGVKHAGFQRSYDRDEFEKELLNRLFAITRSSP